MNDTLKAHFEEIRNVGNQIKSETESFAQLLAKIKETNDSTLQFWKGEASFRYSQAVTEQAKYMDELAKTLESVGTFIIVAANTLEETEQANANSINIG